MSKASINTDIYDYEIYDEYGIGVSPLDDDYERCKRDCEDRHNPLSDDYCKYDED